MSHLTSWLTPRLTARHILLMVTAAVLFGPMFFACAFFACAFFATHPPASSLSPLRLAASLPGPGGIVSPGLQLAHQSGCQGQACALQDPIQEGCVADAETVASVPIVYMGRLVHQMTPTLAIRPGEIIGRIDRRYSSTCQAYWTRAFSFGSTDAAEMTLSPDPNAPNTGLDTQSSSPGPVALSLYTNMTPAPQPATATITLIDEEISEFRVTATLG
jgi:hypothetical protein